MYYRQGHGFEAVRKLLEPASSVSVAARMAGNLARASIRLDTHDAVENGAYWSALRRHLESLVEKESTKELKETPVDSKNSNTATTQAEGVVV